MSNKVKTRQRMGVDSNALERAVPLEVLLLTVVELVSKNYFSDHSVFTESLWIYRITMDLPNVSTINH